MDEIHRKQLLDMAKKSIKYGLENNARLTIKPEEFDSVLREKKATFVTLHLNGALRGCIGSLTFQVMLIVQPLEILAFHHLKKVSLSNCDIIFQF